MLSILDQLKAISPPPRDVPAPKRLPEAAPRTPVVCPFGGRLSARNVDALVLQAVAEHPGETASAVHAAVGRDDVTLIATAESLRRLQDRLQVVQGYRYRQEKARYWPSSLASEAAAFSRSVRPGSRDEEVLACFTDSAPRSQAAIQRMTGLPESGVRRILVRLQRLGFVKRQPPGKGRSLWKKVKPRLAKK